MSERQWKILEIELDTSLAVLMKLIAKIRQRHKLSRPQTFDRERDVHRPGEAIGQGTALRHSLRDRWYRHRAQRCHVLARVADRGLRVRHAVQVERGVGGHEGEGLAGDDATVPVEGLHRVRPRAVGEADVGGAADLRDGLEDEHPQAAKGPAAAPALAVVQAFERAGDGVEGGDAGDREAREVGILVRST